MRNLKYLFTLPFLALAPGCEDKAPESSSTLLLYCDAETDKPVTLTSDDDGSEFEGNLSYRGFYRIDLLAETLEAQFAGNDKFLSLCTTVRPCKLVSNQSEIRFENYGRRWEKKIVDETYVFERTTGHFYRKSETTNSDGSEVEYARGSCRSVNSVDQQLF